MIREQSALVGSLDPRFQGVRIATGASTSNSVQILS